MHIDLAAIGILALAAIVGSFSGALNQLVHLAGMIVGCIAAWNLGPAVGRGLARWLPATVARGAAGLLLFVGFGVLASWVGHRLLASRSVSNAVRSPPDRGLGALLGGAKAGLVLWIALSALALAGGRVALGRFALDGGGSDLAAIAHRYNLLTRWSPVTGRALERLLGELRSPDGRSRLAGDPAVRRLLADPRFRAFVDRTPGERRPTDAEELERARQAFELLDDPEVRSLLQRLGKEAPQAPPAPVPDGAARAR